jgi:putative Mg2+ transporter-C (MgtC) family protein
MIVPGAEVILRILLAFAASLLFGLERQFRKKPVGFGTFTFVTVGACVMAIVAQDLSDTPIVLFGAIMTGIGFLGAGAIIKGGDKKVAGITTAAAIWAFAALGITIGVGLYNIAVMFYLLIGIIIIMDQYFERHGFGAYSKLVAITLKDPVKLKEIEKMLPESHKVFSYGFDNDKKEYTMSFQLSGNRREINTTLNELIKQPGVLKVSVE